MIECKMGRNGVVVQAIKEKKVQRLTRFSEGKALRYR
jgi:hypothetical protein